MSNFIKKLENLDVNKKYSNDYIESLFDEEELEIPVGLTTNYKTKNELNIINNEQNGGFINHNLLLEVSLAIVPFLLIGINDKKFEVKEKSKEKPPTEKKNESSFSIPSFDQMKIPDVKIPEVKIPEVKIPKLSDVKIPKLSDVPNVLDIVPGGKIKLQMP